MIGSSIKKFIKSKASLWGVYIVYLRIRSKDHMLLVIKNLPFAVKKLIHWILPLILGCLSLNILVGIIGFIHFIVFFIPIIVIAPHLLGIEIIWEVWFLVEMIRIPTFSLMGSFIIVRSSSHLLRRFLFSEFKKKRTTS